jgi:Asp-tRNA(Asn)/Glu-tRNA(Gln) amidotransferase A subunit family amidase
MLDVAFMSAEALATAVRRRELDPVSVLEATLAGIERLNPALNAFVALRADAALAEARALRDRIARGEDPGPLAGVPFGVKDLEDLAGLPTTYGSVPFREHRPASDSTQVARLRAAGAIAVGKTNTPEFGYTGFTKNRLFGTTRNPWDLSRTPGGSSGGSSAAIAAGMVPLATASDGGGSVRIPACYTGAFGMKPTFGRIPRGPFRSRDWIDTVSYGPITRTVADAALFLDVVAGRHPLDPDSLPRPERSYRERLDEVPKNLRLGYSPTLGYARVAPDVRREVETAVDALAGALGRPVDLVPDRLTDVGLAWAGLNAFQLHGELAPIIETHRNEWGRGFIGGVDFGGRLTAVDVGRYQAERLQLLQEVAAVFSRVDVLLTPTLPTGAFAAGGPLPNGAGGEPFESPIHAVAFTYPFNMTGHPAATVRAGLTDEGLPCGLQLIAERGREDVLLQLARVCERVRPLDAWPREPFRDGASRS